MMFNAHKARFFFCFAFFALIVSPAHGRTIGENTGDLDALVKFLYRGKARTEQRFTLVVNGKRILLNVRAYRSTISQIDANDNRCTADARANRIVCDLNLLNSLDERFRYPGETRQYLKKDRIKSEKSLLKWIVAHEVGHLELGHAKSDWEDPPRGFLIFNDNRQKLELEADNYAVTLVGNLQKASDDYAFLMGLANSLIAQNLCPGLPCEKMHVGVGLIYNSNNSERIKISAGGSHPDYVARFVRLLYLSGEGTNENSLNYLARRVIERLEVERSPGEWVSVEKAFKKP